MIDPLEYMYHGDTAIAAIQYSFLPSWISFIADKATAWAAIIPPPGWTPERSAELGSLPAN